MSVQIVMMLPPEAGSLSSASPAPAEAMRIAATALDCVHESQAALSDACTNVFYHSAAGQDFEVLINLGDLDVTMHILDSGLGSLPARQGT